MHMFNFKYAYMVFKHSLASETPVSNRVGAHPQQFSVIFLLAILVNL